MDIRSRTTFKTSISSHHTKSSTAFRHSEGIIPVDIISIHPTSHILKEDIKRR